MRGSDMTPAEVHSPLDGSYVSAVSIVPANVAPPVTRTLPSFNKTAVWPVRAVDISHSL